MGLCSSTCILMVVTVMVLVLFKTQWSTIVGGLQVAYS